MVPNIRLRGPKLGNERVTISSECLLQNQNSKGHKLNITIKLEPEVLKGLDSDYSWLGKKEKPSQERNYGNEEKDEIEDLDSDLSSLDYELNQALMSEIDSGGSTIISSEKATLLPSKESSVEQVKTKKIPKKVNKVGTDASKPSAQYIYKTIPSNIKPILVGELGDLDKDEENDLGLVEKFIFSIKDPLSACKITLPVKSIYCVHFQCFDYEAFCIFNKIPAGIKMFTKKDLARKSFEKLAYYEKKPIHSPLRIVIPESGRKPKDSYKASSKIPSYKCPICDVEFQLLDLCISQSFNYFVKSTSKETEKIEIVDMLKYRIIEDRGSASVERQTGDNIIVISDIEDTDDDDEDENNATLIDSADNIFNDGLDEEMIRLSNGELPYQKSKGSGKWDDPITLD
ncbi:uncharacterized protein PRCAT00004800001 [Priceomyces carsonii]|uniref:uncharacterized protein n=1 Tax=Priceomyces carsonii TaxID=28549 RepID=UPI002ED9DE66|nr:unnamed protein product [Priceomyces carsonii]